MTFLKKIAICAAAAAAAISEAATDGVAGVRLTTRMRMNDMGALHQRAARLGVEAERHG